MSGRGAGRRERPSWRGPCPACGKLVPLTRRWHTWGHKPRLAGSNGFLGWCEGGYVDVALRERIPIQESLP